MSEASGGDEGRRLWRHADFLRLWSASVVSGFGSRITREGLAMAAIASLGASPAQIGIIAALSRGPALLVGLFAGGPVDRSAKRPVLVAADLIRAAMLFAVPVAALTHVFNIWWLYVAAAVVGGASALFEMTHHAYLPALIGKADLVEGNAKLSLTDNLAEIGGPALAGVLFRLLTAPLAMAVNAATYVGSAVFLFLIRGREAPAAIDEAPPEHWLSDAITGARAALAHPLVRPLVLMEATMAFFGAFFSANYTFYALRVLHLTPDLLGLAIGVGGVGAVIGATLVPFFVRRLGIGTAIVTTVAAGAAFGVFTPLAPVDAFQGTASLMIAQLFNDGLLTIGFILAASLRQTVLPTGVLARVQGSVFVVTGILGMAGALLGGVLGGAIGPRLVLWIAFAGIWSGTLFPLFSSLRTLKAAPVAAEAASEAF